MHSAELVHQFLRFAYALPETEVLREVRADERLTRVLDTSSRESDRFLLKLWLALRRAPWR